MAAATVTAREVTTLVAQLGGLAILAATLAAATAFLHRWYVGEGVPRFLALLAGLSGVAVYLNTTPALARVIGTAAGTTGSEVALFNIVAFATGGVGAEVGRRAGDRFEVDVFRATGPRAAEADAEVGRLVRTLGRVHQIDLPEDIEDVVGYDPVPAETKAALSGRRFVFPRDLTHEDLETRLTARLKADYAVGHVDLELAGDGSVAYLALGSRAAGIGPTLPPATNAVAVRADPAFSASAGDLVQVWETDPERRVLTAELRGVTDDDVVTLAIDAADTPTVDPEERYRLVTLPVEDRPDREFASLLRAAEETFTSVTVGAGSPLAGLPAGALAVDVVALQPDDGATVPLPGRSRRIEPGDVLFVVARPDALRRLEAASEPCPPGTESTVPPAGRAASPSEALSAPATAAEAGETAGQSEDPGPSGETARGAATGEGGSDADAAPGAAGFDGLRDAVDEGAAGATASEGATGAPGGGDDRASDEGQEQAEEDEEPAGEGDGRAAEGQERAQMDTQDAGGGTEEADEDGEATDDDDDGGGGTVAELKSEFESGEADWVEEAADGPEEEGPGE